MEEQGIAYSDLIQTSILNNKLTQDAAIQCTCHEAANKILQQENHAWPNTTNNNNNMAGQTPILSVRPRGMMIEDSFSSKSSLRFLGGQTKSPRRRSSASSNKKRSISSGQPKQDEMMVDMQSFLFNQPQQQRVSTEIETERSVAFPSNSTSSTSTPNSNYNTTNGILTEEKENGYSDQDIGFMMSTTNADELTSLLNNVLDNSKRQKEREEEERNTHSIMASEMARSTTTNSFSSSSSNNAAVGNFIVPQPPIVCGSFTPHSNCSPAIDTQGESVVITITPLSTLFTASDEERQDKSLNQSNTKAVTRIVTCYCGNSCICPGCFVHPNNYIQQQQYMQQQQYNMQIQQTSSNSSSYSSDDEDQHHLNYSATNYSLL